MWQTSDWWTDNQRWAQCRYCENWQLEQPPQGLRIPPKILYLDVETSLIEMNIKVFDMRVRSGWLDWHDITKPFYIISWAAAWVDDKPIKVFSGAVTGKEAKARKDKRMLARLWEMMDQATHICGHNVKGFDTKKIETRFLLNDMGAPFQFKQVDTLSIVKKYFKPESQSLDYWMRLLGGRQKDHMVRIDWEEVDKGNEKTIRKMQRYNKGDVVSGIQLLKKLMKYIKLKENGILFR